MTVLQGAEVYKTKPNYRLVMRSVRKPEMQLIAVSRHRDRLVLLEEDLTNCDYVFVRLEDIEENSDEKLAQPS